MEMTFSNETTDDTVLECLKYFRGDDIDIPYMKEHNMINESVNNNIYHLFEQNLNDKTLTSRITDNFLVKNEYDDKGILLKKPGKEDSDND